MPRYILDLGLDFDKIRERIEEDMRPFQKKEWADNVKVTQGLISNVHKKKGKESDRAKPSLEYVIAVAKYTGKPIEWYLYGGKEKLQTDYVSESIKPYVSKHQKLHDDLAEILDSGNDETIKAISQNLQEFRESVRKDKRDKEKDLQISALNDKVNQLITELDEMKKKFDELKKPLPEAKIITVAKPETSSE